MEVGNRKSAIENRQSQIANRKSLFWFLGLTFAVSWPIMGGLWWVSRLPAILATLLSTMALMVVMWVPGLSVLIVTTFIAREPLAATGLKRLGIRRTRC